MHTDTQDLGADGPAALARNPRNVTIAGEARGSVATKRITVRRVIECEVDRLHAQHHITGRQCAAGRRFRALWAASAWQPRVTAAWNEQTAVSGAPTARVGHMDARAQIDAVAPVLSQLGWAAVVGVCGEDESASRRLRWLCEGLDALAEFWGIE